MDKTLILIRHVSGAGSSTLANSYKEICDAARVRCVVAAADQYFEKDGQYNWDATKLHQAHKDCFTKVDNAMFFNVSVVIVTNTFTRPKEMKEYIELATKYNYKLVSMVLEKRHDNTNVHSVPDKTLIDQEKRLLNSLKLR